MLSPSWSGVLHIFSKVAMDIEGFGPSSVESLMSEGYIKNIADIYHLKENQDELNKKGIVGREKSVDNLLNAIKIIDERILEKWYLRIYLQK